VDEAEIPAKESIGIGRFADAEAIGVGNGVIEFGDDVSFDLITIDFDPCVQREAIREVKCGCIAAVDQVACAIEIERLVVLSETINRSCGPNKRPVEFISAVILGVSVESVM